MNKESDQLSRYGLRSDQGSSLPSTPTNGGSSPPFTDATDLSRPPFGDGTEYTKVLLLGVAYGGVILIAHWLAYLIRFEFRPPIEYQTLFWQTLQWSLPV